MDVKVIAFCLLIAVGFVNGDYGEECGCPTQGISDCGPTPTIFNGGFMINQGPFGQYAEPVCNPGFEPVPDENLICGCNYKWSDDDCTYCRGELSGTCFVAVFLKATRQSSGNDVFTDIYVTSREETNVSFKVPYTGENSMQLVNGLYKKSLHKSMTLWGRTTNDKVVIINSDKKINVWAHIFRWTKKQIGMEQYIIRPCDELSDEYSLVTNIVTNQYAIASASDTDTTCQIYDELDFYLNSVTIPPEKVYTDFSDPDYDVGDFTGWKIRCNQKAAVFSGTYFANSPPLAKGSRDTGVVQAAPYSEYSRVCITGPNNVDFYQVKILSVNSDTDIHISEGDDGYYSAGFTLQDSENTNVFSREKAMVITTSKPVAIFTINPTSSFVNYVLSDLAFVHCQDPVLWSNDYVVALPERFWAITIKLFIPAQFQDGVLIDGISVTPDYVLPAKVPNGITYLVQYYHVDASTGSLPRAAWISNSYGVSFGCEIFAYRRVGFIDYQCGPNFKAA